MSRLEQWQIEKLESLEGWKEFCGMEENREGTWQDIGFSDDIPRVQHGDFSFCRLSDLAPEKTTNWKKEGF